MTYIKFILLIVGLIFMIGTKVSWHQRHQYSSFSTPYSKGEKITLYISYTLLGMSLVLAALNI